MWLLVLIGIVAYPVCIWVGVCRVSTGPASDVNGKTAAIIGLTVLMLWFITSLFPVAYIFSFPTEPGRADAFTAFMNTWEVALGESAILLPFVTFLAALISNVGGARKALVVAACALLWELMLLAMQISFHATSTLRPWP